MKVVLGGFNAKIDKEDIFKPTIENENPHEVSNDNGVRLVNYAISKNLKVNSTMFPHHNIRKYTCTSLDAKTLCQNDHIQVDR
jgi:hypothetical protein